MPRLHGQRIRANMAPRLAKARKYKALVFWGSATFLLVLCACLAPYIAPFDPAEQNLYSKLQPPNRHHPFGTDQFGRDILSRVICGSRYSLIAGIVSVGIGLTIGVPLGLIAGFSPGCLSTLIMRLMDILLAFPYLLLAIAIVAALGPGLVNTMFAIGIWTMPVYCRLAFTETLAARERPYVEAARAIGAGKVYILRKHILRNIAAPIMVVATLRIADAILTVASLGFLGLGVQPPAPEWGTMLNEARVFLALAPHTLIFPGVAIVFSVLSFNMLGDELREFFDPRTRFRQRA